ncbi:MAG TPA: transglutaminase domain-containing protein [Gemmataceae bacterium]|jgi:transglutaminase-like putative cysteine protease|nr:transglutaminase domain-containing protein [Gemmataceae bacterium]
MSKLIGISLGAMIALGAVSAAEPLKLDPNLPYQAKKSNPVTYDVDFSVVVTPPYHSKVLKVWLPLPQSDVAQEVVEKELTSFPINVEPRVGQEETYGNKFAYFEFQNPEGAQIVRHKFKITVWELHWNLDPDRVEKVERWPAAFDLYLRSDQSVLVDDRFRKVAHEIVPDRHGPARDLATVMNWVNGYMKYDHAAASLRASSEHALTTHAGHCSDYHGLCAAVSRALGYPTRITYGINAFPKNSPSHCKVEAFIPPYGWVSFDVSETQNLINAIKKSKDLDAKKKDDLIRAATERLASGFRDNTWFLQTRGTDYELMPPAAKRVPVVRTIHAEADGVALPDPDPANPHKHEFSWMTVHQYTADKKVPYPFKDWSTLNLKP